MEPKSCYTYVGFEVCETRIAIAEPKLGRNLEGSKMSNHWIQGVSNIYTWAISGA